MGYEYMINFEIHIREEIDGLLRSVSGFEGYDPRYCLYNFRRTSTGQMPDAHAKFEETGLYVCVNGARGLKWTPEAGQRAAAISVTIAGQRKALGFW